jgi:hypothetical protein
VDKLEDKEDWVDFCFWLELDEDDFADGLAEKELDEDAFFLLELDFEEEASDFW